VQEAGRQGIDDASQLAHATADSRAVVTHNRRDYFRLHRQVRPHGGIVVCTRDADNAALADRIHRSIASVTSLENQLLRVNRPPSTP
jgi:hypothetical protein